MHRHTGFSDDARHFCRQLDDLCCKGSEGYIVERIVGQKAQTAYFEGLIEVFGLPRSLCPPLKLCSVDVKDIWSQIHDGVSCCTDQQKIKLALICHVCDARGCSAEGSAVVEVILPACDICLSKEHIMIRRGAQIDIQHARFCSFSLIDAQLKICIRTVVSDCAKLIGKDTVRCCTTVPLYPHLSLPTGGRFSETKKRKPSKYL